MPDRTTNDRSGANPAMRFISFLLLALSTVAVIFLSVANRQLVRINLTPDFTGYGLPPGPSHEVPLFVMALACGTIGFILGAAREYLRESRLRREAKLHKREMVALRRELDTLRGAQKAEEDEDLLMLASR
jgi:hypothetical protein